MNPRMMAGDDYWGQFTDYAQAGAEPTFGTKQMDPNSEGANGGYAGSGILGPTTITLPDGTTRTSQGEGAYMNPGGGGNTIDDFERAWRASGGRTVTDLQNFVAANPQYGVKLGGSKGDKVYGPDGSFWADAVISAGLGGGQGATFDRATGGGGTMGALGGGGGLSGITQGQFIAPWTEQFTARDPNQIAQDPAYQFQLGQGTQAIMRNKAAMGSLLTGGTLKALDRYGQGLASTYNDKYYDRDMGEYGLRRENFYANQDRPFSKLFQTASLGKPGA